MDEMDEDTDRSRLVLIMTTGMVGGGRQRNHSLMAAKDD